MQAGGLGEGDEPSRLNVIFCIYHYVNEFDLVEDIFGHQLSAGYFHRRQNYDSLAQLGADGLQLLHIIHVRTRT